VTDDVLKEIGSSGVARGSARAVRTVIQTFQAGIPIARCEALCGLTMQAINARNQTSYRGQPTLFLEFNGTQSSVEE
jgi:D-lactate dehydrogenase (cytochrome)